VKGLLLAAAGTLALALAMTLLLRVARPQRRVAALLRLFVVSLPVFVATYLFTPADLWLLPAALVDGPLVGLLFGAAVYGALFVGGLMQLYNLADRGFSLRILIDIDEQRPRALGVPEILRVYGGGQGMKWMIAKRIDGLMHEGLAETRDGRLVPTPRGRRAVAGFTRARALLRLEA
jgi:hypothetical protein